MPAQSNDIGELGRRIVFHAYPELAGRDIEATTSNLRSYGQVRWSDTDRINITCHQDTVCWPEPAIIGLLAHEISHPAKGKYSSEETTDLDVIDRGLGHYLATERAYVNKYEDHTVRGCKDRYLGFQSIRELLNEHEKGMLEKLLEDFRIIPSKKTTRFRLIQDTAIHDDVGHTTLMIEGQSIRVKGVGADSDLKLLFRDKVLYVYADDEVVVKVPWHS
ncbi:MAG: hypothetical protein ACFFER_06745 [Candidatus Thorarchaeota archaeon]